MAQGKLPLAFPVRLGRTWDQAMKDRGLRGKPQMPICFLQKDSDAQYSSQVHSLCVETLLCLVCLLLDPLAPALWCLLAGLVALDEGCRLLVGPVALEGCCLLVGPVALEGCCPTSLPTEVQLKGAEDKVYLAMTSTIMIIGEVRPSAKGSPQTALFRGEPRALASGLVPVVGNAQDGRCEFAPLPAGEASAATVLKSAWWRLASAATAEVATLVSGQRRTVPAAAELAATPVAEQRTTTANQQGSKLGV